jgi:glycosyltransferase involved in cell wall biosynthesis
MMPAWTGQRPGTVTAPPACPVAPGTGGAMARSTPDHIALLGPVATADIAHLLGAAPAALPAGYSGAPILATLIESLLARGLRVTAITLSADLPLRDDCMKTAAYGRFTIVYCPMRPKAWPPNGSLPGHIVDLYAFERRQLLAAIRQAAPGVVHAHWACEFAWAALSSGLPHLVTSHESPFTVARHYRGLKLGGYRWLRALMSWQALRQARRVSTVSPYLAERIGPLCRVPVEVVPNPIDERVFTLARTAEPQRRRVLMVCNGWSTHKNPAAALHGFAAMSHRIPDAELVVLGDDFGPQQSAAQWWRSQALEGRVRFVGPVSHGAVLDWMTRSDVLLHPALEESFGAVVAEAMAAGLPVLAGQDSGAVPWVVGEHGCLVDVNRPDAIANGLAGLLADLPWRERLSRGARAAAAQRFAAAQVAEQYSAIYTTLIAAPAPAPAVAGF